MSSNEQASRNRSRLCALVEHLGRLAKQAQGRSPLLPGTVYEHRRRCGKRHCRCAKGKAHVQRVFSVHQDGASRQVSMAGIDWEELTQCVRAHREFRGTRAAIVRTCAELIETVDTLGKLRRISLDPSLTVGGAPPMRIWQSRGFYHHTQTAG